MWGFSTPIKQNLAEFSRLSRIWQNLADIADIANIADIADIIVETGPYIPFPLTIQQLNT